MAASFIDYAIALGLMLVAFAATISVVTNFSMTAQSNIRLSTLQFQAASLLGLAERGPAFDTSISGMGLATSVTSAQTSITVLDNTALQLLAAKNYSSIKEDFDFHIKLIDTDGTMVFDYGQLPPFTTVVALQKHVMYKTAAGTSTGTFMVEVW